MKDFSNSKRPTHKPMTVRDARKASKANVRRYMEIVSAALGKNSYAKKNPKRFQALLGKRRYAGKILASDVEARFDLQQQLVKHIVDHKKQNPDQRFFFLSFMSDPFRSAKKDPIIWLKRLRVMTDKAIRMLCKKHKLIGGIGMVECAFVLNPVDLREPVYQWHAHALVWAADDFNQSEAKDSLNGLRNWNCASGIDPIRMKEITPDRGSPAYWAYYLSKMPVDAVNFVESEEGKFKIRNTTKGYRDDAILRLHEALVRIPLQDLLFGIADGKFIRDPVMRVVKTNHRLRRKDQVPIDFRNRPQKWFKKIWSSSRADHTKPWAIYL